MKKELLIGIPMAVAMSIAVGVKNETYSANIKAEVMAYALNVRSGAGTNFPIIEVLKRGDVVTILEKDTWARVSYNGKEGYTSLKYLKEKTTETTTEGKVIASSLNVRSGPSTTYSKIGYLTEGTTVQIVGETNGWYKIKYSNKYGYVLSQYIRTSGGQQDTNNNSTSIRKGTVNAFTLNVRSGPSTTYSKIGYLTEGTTVQIVGETNGWYKIKYSNKYGYVLSQYIRTSGGQQESSQNTSLKQNEGLILVNVSVRSGPATSYAKIGTLPKGKVVKVLGQKDGFNKITYGNKSGYVSATFVKRSFDTSKYVICINTHSNILDLYESNGRLVKSYRCSTGKASTPTPRTVTIIHNKIVDRPYYKEGIPGGDPRNPLGRRWMGLVIDGTYGTTYAIHGNNDESSIGKNISGGCIRMHNTDVKELFEIVPIGTKVVIQK